MSVDDREASPSGQERDGAETRPTATMRSRALYEDDSIALMLRPLESSRLLVTFTPAGLVGGRNAFWGSELGAKLGCDVLGVVCKAVNWFPPESMRAAAEAAGPLLDGRSEIVTYGFSLGAYGALKYGNLLRADLTLAFSPQSPSVRAAIPQTREARQNRDWAALEVGPADVAPRVHVFYDPLQPLDRRSANVLFRSGVRCMAFPTYGAGHYSLRPFLKTFVSVFEACRDDDRARLAALWAYARRLHPGRPATLARVAARRHPALAARLHERFRERFSPTDEAELLLQLVSAWDRAGRSDEAGRAMEALAGLKLSHRQIVELEEARAALGDMGGHVPPPFAPGGGACSG